MFNKQDLKLGTVEHNSKLVRYLEIALRINKANNSRHGKDTEIMITAENTFLSKKLKNDSIRLI